MEIWNAQGRAAKLIFGVGILKREPYDFSISVI
jgi:hypothetical protein